MEYPSVTKYDPKPTYLKKSFINDGLGVLRSVRDYSYLPKMKTPGPGVYDTKDDTYLPNTMTYGTISRAERDTGLSSKAGIPGPGEYNLVRRSYEKHNYDLMRDKAANYRELRKGRSVNRQQF